jgi:hypothetical protein
MPIAGLRPPRTLAGDEPGLFTPGGAGRDLRILVDLPVAQRQVDDSAASSGLDVPDPARFLWTLGRHRDTATFWMAERER